jgi:hypothetical protein
VGDAAVWIYPTATRTAPGNWERGWKREKALVGLSGGLFQPDQARGTWDGGDSAFYIIKTWLMDEEVEACQGFKGEV